MKSWNDAASRAKFVRDHSLSLVLAAGFIVCTVISYLVEYGTWAADFWLGMTGIFGGGFVIVALSVKLGERGSDPSKPPD